MKINGFPNNSNTSVADPKLKLVAAASLPPTFVAEPKPAQEASSQKAPLKAPPELSDEALVQITKLKARDAQVRQHEQAHLSASGGVNVSNASFTYQRGPNGVNYAVGGDVRIDSSPGHTPEETLSRAEMIIDAALAPTDPTPVDRSVAAKAQNMAQQARIELQQQAALDAANKSEKQSSVSQAYDSRGPAKHKIDTYV